MTHNFWEHPNERPGTCATCGCRVATGQGVFGAWYSDEDDEMHYPLYHADKAICERRSLQRRVMKLQEADSEGRVIAAPLPQPYEGRYWEAGEDEPERRRRRFRQVADSLIDFVPLTPDGAEGFTHFCMSGTPQAPRFWLVEVQPEPEPEPDAVPTYNADGHRIIYLHEPHD